MKRFFLGLLSVLLLLPSVCVGGIESSAPISFFKEFEFVEKNYSLSVGGVSISLTLDSRLVFIENMVVRASSSMEYVKEGETCSITVIPKNAVSLLRLTGDIGGSFNYLGIPVDIDFKHFQITQSVSEVIGEPTSIELDEEMIFIGTVPLLGVQITIYIKPVLEYTPFLNGDLSVDGPAQITRGMEWRNGGLRSDVEFLSTQPVSFSISEPRYEMTNFRVTLDVYAKVIGFSIVTQRQELIDFGSDVLYADDFELMSLEPDYFELYNELLEFNYPPVEELNVINDNISDIADELDDLLEEITYLHEGYIDLQDADIEILGDFQGLQGLVEATENSVNDLSSRYESSKANIDSRLEELSEENTRLKQASDDLKTIVYVSIGVSILCAIICLWMISNVLQRSR